MGGVWHEWGEEYCGDSKKWDRTQNVRTEESWGLIIQNPSANTAYIYIYICILCILREEDPKHRSLFISPEKFDNYPL